MDSCTPILGAFAIAALAATNPGCSHPGRLAANRGHHAADPEKYHCHHCVHRGARRFGS